MPNTLAHIGIQVLATRGMVRNADVKWVLAGCVIPDLPWILRRVAGAVADVNPYDLKLYAVVQSSLFFCLIAGFLLATFSRCYWKTFFILALNAFFHLVLDGLQIKWANGIHLVAPLNWHAASFGFFWPESPVTFFLTGLGLLCFGVLWKRQPGTASKPVWRPAHLAALLAVYLVLPLAFTADAETADNHFVRTLRNTEGRKGKVVELDRARWQRDGNPAVLVTFAGERIPVQGLADPGGGAVSIRGVFTESGRIRVTEAHVHLGGFRDAASWVGLALIALYWTAAIQGKRRPNLPIPATEDRSKT